MYKPLPHQEPPVDENWKTWVISGARGSGKTECFSQYINMIATKNPGTKIAIVGPVYTMATIVRDKIKFINENTMVIPSGIVWTNGSRATLFSVAVPDIGQKIRSSGRYHVGFAEEVDMWGTKQDAALSALYTAVSEGMHPSLLMTLKNSFLYDILASASTRYSTARTSNNPYINAEILAHLEEMYGTNLLEI